MFLDVNQPAVHGLAVASYINSSSVLDHRSAFQVMPINLSPEEIRAMVRDILG